MYGWKVTHARLEGHMYMYSWKVTHARLSNSTYQSTGAAYLAHLAVVSLCILRWHISLLLHVGRALVLLVDVLLYYLLLNWGQISRGCAGRGGIIPLWLIADSLHRYK